MKLTDFVVKEAIIPELESLDCEGVLRELVQALVRGGKIKSEDAENVVERLIEREKSGTTGFGKGVAVPHVQGIEVVEEQIGTVGRSSRGVDFNSLDKAPVSIILLLLTPPNQRDIHLQAMEKIFRHLQKANFRRFLRQAETVEGIWELLEESDASEE
jgi:mannitol/fructose-specific phosphotransferase system IIA component (Ntr-type)